MCIDLSFMHRVFLILMKLQLCFFQLWNQRGCCWCLAFVFIHKMFWDCCCLDGPVIPVFWHAILGTFVRLINVPICWSFGLLKSNDIPLNSMLCSMLSIIAAGYLVICDFLACGVVWHVFHGITWFCLTRYWNVLWLWMDAELGILFLDLWESSQAGKLLNVHIICILHHH